MKTINHVFSPSLISIADPLNVERDVKLLIQAGFSTFHLDVMDLNLVPNIAMGFDEVNRLVQLPIVRDIHLMVKDVKTAVDKLILSKKDTILFHVEDSAVVTGEIIHYIRAKSKVGLVINPETPIETLEPYISSVDKILFMAVQPGFGGQAFIQETYGRLERFMHHVQKIQSCVLVGVDGGVGIEQIKKLESTGVRWFVIGKQIFYSDIQKDAKHFFEVFSQHHPS